MRTFDEIRDDITQIVNDEAYNLDDQSIEDLVDLLTDLSNELFFHLYPDARN